MRKLCPQLLFFIIFQQSFFIFSLFLPVSLFSYFLLHSPSLCLSLLSSSSHQRWVGFFALETRLRGRLGLRSHNPQVLRCLLLFSSHGSSSNRSDRWFSLMGRWALIGWSWICAEILGFYLSCSLIWTWFGCVWLRSFRLFSFWWLMHTESFGFWWFSISIAALMPSHSPEISIFESS